MKLLLISKIKNRHARQFILMALKCTITGGIAWYLISKINIESSIEYLANFELTWGIFSLIILIILFFIAAIRWLIYARTLNIPLTIGAAFRFYLISQFFGQVLPAGIGGDAVRVWLLTRKKIGVGPSASSVILERLTGLIGLVALITVLLPVSFTFIDDANIRIGLISVVAISTGSLTVLVGLSYVPHLITRWYSGSILLRLETAVRETRKAGFKLKPALSVMALSILMHLLSILIIYLLACGLKLEISPVACLALFPIVLLLSTLPISVAGWGVREGAMVIALDFVGTGASEALALSILFGLTILTISLLGSVFWLVGNHSVLKSASTDKYEPRINSNE